MFRSRCGSGAVTMRYSRLRRLSRFISSPVSGDPSSITPMLAIAGKSALRYSAQKLQHAIEYRGPGGLGVNVRLRAVHESFRRGQGHARSRHVVIVTAGRRAQHLPAVRIDPRASGRSCFIDAVLHLGNRQLDGAGIGRSRWRAPEEARPEVASYFDFVTAIFCRSYTPRPSRLAYSMCPGSRMKLLNRGSRLRPGFTAIHGTIPNGKRAFGFAFVLDDIQQQAIDGDRIGAEHDGLGIEPELGIF